MSVATKCKFVKEVGWALAGRQDFDEEDGRRCPLGRIPGTGLEVGLCTQHCRDRGRWGQGGHSQATIDEEASSVPGGQDGPEAQPCISSADRPSTGLDLPSGNCR